MAKIPVRRITQTTKEQVSSGSFKIRDVRNILAGKDMVHELHRHDFFFILALQKGKGIHEIDFTRYDVRDNSIFILRPGQVHRLELKANCTGFLMEFDPSFYQPKNTISSQRWKKVSGKNYCQVEAGKFM